ncbi:MAG: hypothetical protein MK207_12730 [Saprospiraceae bacterium]|nr:hypothetical protein [Saprospiraceae bacterium]
MSRKKNKKSFSDNLELLFQERMHDDNAQDTLALIEDEPEVENSTVVVKEPKVKQTTSITTQSQKQKKKKGKSFANNLQQFFQESLDEHDEEKVVAVKNKNKQDGKGESRVVGLDLLIRQTTKENIKYKSRRNKLNTKRVTVVLETKKIDELKRIAKLEKLRLYQIIGGLVAGYIDEMNQK